MSSSERQSSPRRVAIVGGSRIPFVKSFTSYRRTTNQEMITAVLKDLVRKYNLQGKLVGDVSIGALMKHSSDWNLAREVVLDSGLNPCTPAYGTERACGTSLDATLQIALKIAAGQIDVGIAGGTDTNSDIPILYPREFVWKLLDLRDAPNAFSKLGKALSFRPMDFKPWTLGVIEPRTGKSMGQHCELMVQEWGISQREQDEIALQSHQKAEQAYQDGFYKDSVIEFKGVKKDTVIRANTNLEKMAKLKPAFDFSGKGTLTAANSSPLSDGASAALLCSEDFAKQNKLPILAYFVDAQAAAVDFVKGEGLLMAPTIAVSDLLKRNSLNLQDFDFYEIHEAFAGQVACTLKAWESDDYCRARLGRDRAMGAIDRKK